METSGVTARPKFFTKSVIAKHNMPDDCWVSIYGVVFDITTLTKNNAGPLIQPILKHAGKDISHWFKPKSRDIKTYVDPETNIVSPYVPMGRFLHVPPTLPTTDWDNNFETPWWKDEAKYKVGLVTAKPRRVRIINTLTEQDHVLEVCSEQTLFEILTHYLKYNKHAGSYAWKRMGRLLDMNRTLAENGIEDEDNEFEDLDIDENSYIPAVHLYYKDDLTVG